MTAQAKAVSDVRASRRSLLVDGIGLAVSTGAFALVYGLASRDAGLSLVETAAMSALVFAGASQFAAVGLIAQGMPWPAIVALTGLLNARHLLYSAALAPWLSGTRRRTRALVAHLVTDEAFGLTLPHFQRLGRADPGGYWLAAVALTFVPWNVGTVLGYVGGGLIPDPELLGLDIVYPAAMGGLAVALVVGRRELIAAAFGAIIAVIAGLAISPTVGVVVGGVAGPLVAVLAAPPTARVDRPDHGSEASEAGDAGGAHGPDRGAP